MITQYIPHIFKGLVEQVSTEMQEYENVERTPVQFDFGHYEEIEKNVKQKEASTSAREFRFPLIWLVMDFEEAMGTNPADYAVVNNMRFIIATTTSPSWKMEERWQKNYSRILYPIYSKFITAMSQSVELGMPAEKLLTHTKIDRPFWGGMPEGNLFSNHIDAIEIRNLKLKVKHKIC